MSKQNQDDIREGYVAVGRILGAWGVHGDLKVQPLAPDEAFKPGRTIEIGPAAHTVERSRRKERLLYLKLSGIHNREAAAALRGRYLEVAEADLPPPAEDTYYWYQLIGLRVESTEGEHLGEIADILTTAGNDVFVVRGPRGEILVPGIDDIVQSINIEAGRMVVEVVPGLLP